MNNYNDILKFICDNKIRYVNTGEPEFTLSIIEHSKLPGYILNVECDDGSFEFNTLGFDSYGDMVNTMNSVDQIWNFDCRSAFESYKSSEGALITYNFGEYYATIPTFYVKPFCKFSNIIHYDIHNKKLNEFIQYVINKK